jgi:hypothetical protein
MAIDPYTRDNGDISKINILSIHLRRLTNCPQLRVFDNVTSCLSMIGQLHQSQR